MPESTAPVRCKHCCHDLVKEEVGYRSASRDLRQDRVACAKSPNGRHEPADLMARIPVQDAMGCHRGFRTGGLA
jgi:hypothetical protein